MTESARSLREYVESGSDEAFAEIVSSHVDLVYSAALRVVAEDAHLARDVSQTVFIDLARKAAKLPANVLLSGWLYRHTFFTALNAIRTERRRQAREREAVAMQILNEDTESVWKQLTPVLDEAVNRLNSKERDALVLRFFQQKPFRAVGDSLGVSEEAARKRVDRAINTLRSLLVRRGIALSAVALSTALGAKSVSAAPAGLATALATCSAGAASSASAGFLQSIFEIVAMTKPQAVILALLFAAGIATPVLVGIGSAQKIPGTTRASAKGEGAGTLQAKDETKFAQSGNSNGQSETNSPLALLQAFLRKTDQGRSVWGNLTREEQQELEFLTWSLPAVDYPKAFGLTNELKRSPLRRAFEEALTGYWSEFDPRAALAAVQETRDAGWLAGKIVPNWAARSPADALAWVRQSAAEQIHDASLGAVLPELARADIPGAMAALEEMASGMLKQQTLSALVTQWASRDPSAAANYTTNLPMSAQRAKLIAAVAETWAKEDSEAVVSWAQNLPMADQAHTWEGVLRVMGEKSPAQAAAILEQMANEGDAARAIQNWAHEASAGMIPVLDKIAPTVKNWAKADLNGAAQWVQELPEGKFRQFALGGLLEEWSNRDPRNAAEFAASVATEHENYQLQLVVCSWAGKDSQAAADWVKGLPDGAGRNAALSGFCGALALSKPAEAASLVADLPPSDDLSKFAANVAVGWACNDPLAAIQWVAAFPEGAARLRTLDALGQFFQNGDRNLDGCRRWLDATSLLSATEKLKLLGK